MLAELFRKPELYEKAEEGNRKGRGDQERHQGHRKGDQDPQEEDSIF